jgi:tRNA threonylcarbamoyladenosine biosynthesis protein TsaE
VKFQSNSEAETREIGFRLGKKIKRGDVVCLYGELGSGKTTMVKGIARALGISERDITSASFSIIVEYDSDIPFYHIDLYRIENNEVASLGLHEYIGMEGISVIEWAERAEKEIPDNRIKVILEYTGENSREIWIDGISLDKED